MNVLNILLLLIFLGNIVCIISIYALMEYYHCTMFLKQIATLSNFCWAMCYIPLFINNCVQTMFLMFVFMLRERFAVVNLEIKSVGEGSRTLKNNKVSPVLKVSDSPDQKLAIIQNIHYQLCDIGKLFNEAFSLQLLLIIGNIFVTFTSISYFCFQSFKSYFTGGDFNSYHSLTALYWAVSKLLQVLYISVICTLATYEVSIIWH